MHKHSRRVLSIDANEQFDDDDFNMERIQLILSSSLA